MSASVLEWREHALRRCGLRVSQCGESNLIPICHSRKPELEKLVEEVVVLGFLVSTISGFEVCAHFFFNCSSDSLRPPMEFRE